MSLKFRLWDKNAGRWTALSENPAKYVRFEQGRIVLDGGEDVVIERYTGLKDGHGREIYEGDIVESSVIINRIRPANGVFLVRWNRYLANWALDWNGRDANGLITNPNARGLQNPYCDWCTDFAKLNGAKSSKLSIVGNIHENPELLKP